jgi:hypothetical protein
VQAPLALALALNLSFGFAAAPPIGVATARGSFHVDNATVSGNATLFEGARIETGRASSQLRLNTGAAMWLSADSQGVVYRDRIVLERGSGRFENAVDALTMRVAPEGGAAEVAVRRAGPAGPAAIEVAAVNGPVRVTAANGMLLARVPAGRALAFVPGSEPDAPASVTGCLESAGGKFLLTDEVSLVRFEITGPGLRGEAGHRVQIDGAVTPVTGGMSRIAASSVKQLAKKCSSRAATAAAAAGVGAAAGGAASGSAGAGAATGAAIGSAIATKAVIAGVVVAGVATGTAVAVVGQDEEPETISPTTR